ncbi:16035_t:CDS:1, partial [Funneliformis mosseae]
VEVKTKVMCTYVTNSHELNVERGTLVLSILAVNPEAFYLHY